MEQITFTPNGIVRKTRSGFTVINAGSESQPTDTQSGGSSWRLAIKLSAALGPALLIVSAAVISSVVFWEPLLDSAVCNSTSTQCQSHVSC